MPDNRTATVLASASDGEPQKAANPASAKWARACRLERLDPSRPVAVRLEGKQVALFVRDGEVFACDNRCPHEGYPLVEGAFGEDCVLTCHWHNWKFDLKSGATLYGGDALRIYPARVHDGDVWLDLRDRPAAERIELALAHLDEAMAEFDTTRIARELARLALAGAGPETALARAIRSTYVRLPDGMTHAYAAADAWMHLRDTVVDPAQRLACASEALAYIAWDTLREPIEAFTPERAAWDTAQFAAAVEAQDEPRAAALLNGALADGMHLADIETALGEAALAHYNDFGHSLIYLMHLRNLVERLGPQVEQPLLLAWLRSLILATREDLLPDFRPYAQALATWRSGSASNALRSDPNAFEGCSVRQALAATVALRDHAPLDVYFALMEASARHLLRFDERHALRADNGLADNVGWLDFSHALTFGHALRRQCERQPALWAQGLLQLALFVGRNSKYLDSESTAQRVIHQWAVRDEKEFRESAAAAVIDHGIGLPIFPAHLLKTWGAVRDEIDLGVPDSVRAALLAAVNRLLAVRFKQRHALRSARQALRFVGTEEAEAAETSDPSSPVR
ncbi:MAG: Rieske (2Fe-2S) protein [Burkholderiaceae bacterium]|nr:Rieske (2Fe-2S) protein [Burkholderiaceae bacterium]